MSTAQRHAFVTDVPDLSAFAWPEDELVEAREELTPPVSRIQVAKLGKFSHPRYGKFAITPAVFDSFIRNFAAGVAGDRLPGDFDHEPDMGGKTAACGWLTALEVDGNGLYGQVEWTWDGAFAIRSGSYRWISPTWSMNFTDEEGVKHGPTLLAFGCTNRPYFRMAAVSLSQSFSAAFAGLPGVTTEDTAAWSDSRAGMATLPEMIEFYGLPPDADADQVLTAATDAIEAATAAIQAEADRVAAETAEAEAAAQAEAERTAAAASEAAQVAVAAAHAEAEAEAARVAAADAAARASRFALEARQPNLSHLAEQLLHAPDLHLVRPR